MILMFWARRLIVALHRLQEEKLMSSMSQYKHDLVAPTRRGMVSPLSTGHWTFRMRGQSRTKVPNVYNRHF